MLPLPLSLGLLLIAWLLGSALAARHLRGGATPPPSGLFGALHGLVGIVGVAALSVALQGPPRGVAMGVGAFGRIAAALLVLALLAGLIMFVMRLRARRIPALVIGIHATIAVSGIVICAAYTLVG